MTTETISQAVAKRDDSPGALVAQYADSFARVLPSHIKPDTWVRLTQGALKKGKVINAPNPRDPMHAYDGQFELAVAARNNPPVFLAALLDAARLGLEPGTEAYYLTPRKVKGQLEVLGIVGYQGYIELMYRAGAVSSVVVQVVRRNDAYEFVRGQLDYEHPKRWEGPQVVPFHKFPPFSREADRGPLIGVYAYARMKDGAVSQVIELGQDDIDRIKASSQGATSEYSPWVKFEAAMWLKSATRQLRKWVPTSAEFMRMQAQADVAAREVSDEKAWPAAPTDDTDILDGEIVDSESQNDWSDGSTDSPIQAGAAASPADRAMLSTQRSKMFALFTEMGLTDREQQINFMGEKIGRPVNSRGDITAREAAMVIDALEAWKASEEPPVGVGV